MFQYRIVNSVTTHVKVASDSEQAFNLRIGMPFKMNIIMFGHEIYISFAQLRHSLPDITERVHLISVITTVTSIITIHY